MIQSRCNKKLFCVFKKRIKRVSEFFFNDGIATQQKYIPMKERKKEKKNDENKLKVNSLTESGEIPYH